MFYAAICDDEDYYRRTIRRLLSIYLDKKRLDYRIDVFASGEELCDKGQEIVIYDVVFLDISMDRLDGIETARRIKKLKPDLYVVFITAFINFAVDGYKAEAIRYILKDNLGPSIVECMDVIIEKMRLQNNRVFLPFIEGKKKVPINKIMGIESRSHKLIFSIVDAPGNIERCSIYEKLDNVEQEFKNYGFVRIHKSYLLNMKYLEKIANYEAILSNGMRLPVSKSRYRQAKEDFVAFKGDLC